MDWAGREGAEHTHYSTILFLKDAHSPRNFDWPPEVHNANSTAQPGQHQKMTFPTTTTLPTSCMGGANSPPHNQQPFTHWQLLLQPDCARIPPGSSTSFTVLEGLCQANRVSMEKFTQSEGTPTPTHAKSIGPTSKAQFQKARPNLRHQNQHQLTHTCTAHRRLGIPTHQIVFVSLVIKNFDLALMWAITGLFFLNFSCIMLPGSTWHILCAKKYMYGFLGPPLYNFSCGSRSPPKLVSVINTLMPPILSTIVVSVLLQPGSL